MLHLVRRLLATYRQKGLVRATWKSFHFIFRYFRHLFGKKGLHGCQFYHDFLIWWNSGRGRYSAIADPFNIIYLNPDEIEYVTKRGPNPGRFQFEDLGLIRSGNWDQSDERFDEIPVVQALFGRYDEKKCWDEIEYIQKIKSNKDSGHGRWRVNTDTELQRQCDAIDGIYSSINKSGYLSKAKLAEQGLSRENKYTTNDQLERYNEVAVDISRDGQFLFVDGRHRLAIAKILGIDEIPVRVSARHEEWQRKRESYANQIDSAAIPKRYRTHPDMQDVLPDESKTNE